MPRRLHDRRRVVGIDDGELVLAADATVVNGGVRDSHRHHPRRFARWTGGGSHGRDGTHGHSSSSMVPLVLASDGGSQRGAFAAVTSVNEALRRGLRNCGVLVVRADVATRRPGFDW